MDYLIENYWLVVGCGGALVVSLLIYLPWKRRKDLHQLASSMGLPFSERGPEVSDIGLDLFYHGSSKTSANRIQMRSSEFTIDFFDYSYVSGSGRSRSTHSFTVAVIDCPKAQLPEFELKPETFLYKLGELIGFRDIDLPAFPLFSEKYRLTSPDEAAVRMYFTPRRASWFERNPGLRLQAARNHVVFLKRQGRLPVDAWPAFMEEVKAFASEALR
jgi:hypothetical protein